MNGDLWLVVAVLLGAAAVGIAVLIAVTVTIRRLERSTPHPEHPSQYGQTTEADTFTSGRAWLTEGDKRA